MDSTNPEVNEAISAFLSTYKEDKSSGGLRSIAEYKRLFPGIGAAIERYCLADDRPAGDGGPTDTSMMVRRAATGDEDSLDWTIAHFTPFLAAQIRYRLPKSVQDGQVDDLVHETWLVALNKFTQLQARGGRLTPVLVKFLAGTALNLCRRHIERRSRPSRMGRFPDLSPDGDENQAFDQQPAAHIGPSEDAMHGETVRFVSAAIALLHEDKREAVILRLIEQRSNEEAAGIAGVSPNTFAVRYHRALKELRDVVPPTLLEDLSADA